MDPREDSQQEVVESYPVLPEELLTPEDFESDEEYNAYMESVEAPAGASVEVGLTGIKVDGSEALVVFVLIAIPLLYWIKKKIDSKFAK